MAGSPQWRQDHFVDPQPLVNDNWESLAGVFRPSPPRSPLAPIPVVTGDATRFQTAPPTGLRVTWFGHSTMLVELDGHRVLTDPLWSDRASPIPGVGPRAWYAPPLALAELPPLDAVVISHDHYDHLDRRTIVALNNLIRERGWNTAFVVPLGIGAHLAYWGVPEARIVELDWWQSTRIAASLPGAASLQGAASLGTRRAKAASPPQPIAGGSEPFEGSELTSSARRRATPPAA